MKPNPDQLPETPIKAIVCRKCACRDMRVVYTRQSTMLKAIVRVRECRNCGTRVRTTERIA